MPNKTIYLKTIKDFETTAGLSLINADEVAKKLQDAWKKDTTQAKLDYLVAYREVFRDVLKKWSDNELSKAFNDRSKTMPDFKKCLLKTDEALKLCAMSLIPELRENEDVLSHMTFGVIESTKLKDEFVAGRLKYLGIKASENAVKKRKAEAYDKYKSTWLETTTRRITELVRDEEALRLMSQDEKIGYALALEAYRNDTTLNRPFGQQEKDWIDDALQLWKQEIGCKNGESLEDFLGGQYFQYSQKLGENEWLTNQVNEAIAEYNNDPNPAKKEIERYKAAEVKLAQEKEQQKQKERTNPSAKLTDDTLEMVGGFFRQEELKQDIAEEPLHKERVFLQERVEKFNKEYSLKINYHKVHTSVEQLSKLMMTAWEEKQRFLDKNSVVVIENGKETCYDAKEYYKDLVDEANATCFYRLQKIEEDRLREEEKHKKLLVEIDKLAKANDEETMKKLREDAEKAFQEKNKGFTDAIAKAKAALNKELSAVQGGIVIEKNGETKKQYTSSRYYETHETQKEQYAYGEYQLLYTRIYKDACKNIKEKNYAEGKIVDFSHVAKDVDDLLKSAMYLSNVYDNDKNMEIVQKCSYGGLSAERLASFAAYIDGDDWTKSQYQDSLWSKQSDKARKILTQWTQDEIKDKKVKPAVRIKETLENRLKGFNKGEITQKQLLDYMIAGAAYLETKYPSRLSRVLNFIQYNRVENAVNKCRAALGITERTSLRVAMNLKYTELASSMTKEKIFKSIETRMDYSLGFKAEKMSFEQEHQRVKDREVARKQDEIEKLKALDKEPISIPQLNEKEVILNQKPRVKPIAPPAKSQLSLQVN